MLNLVEYGKKFAGWGGYAYADLVSIAINLPIFTARAEH
jgi:hypothetical protein